MNAGTEQCVTCLYNLNGQNFVLTIVADCQKVRFAPEN
jgi:hypothetical protein